MSPEEFRRFGHRVVDWLADYRARVAELPVTTAAEPGDLLAKLPANPPVEPEGFEAVLRDLDELLLPALSHWQHPRFFGYFPSNGDLSSVLGDFLSTGLGVLGLAWQSAPALTELEDRATDWLRQMLGLAEHFDGVIQDTASTGSLVAMLAARERRPEVPLGQKTVYTSGHAHSSIDKAVLLAGFARENFRKVATTADYALEPAALRAAIAADVERGLVPTAIVATTGTTTTTAMDPITECAEQAAQHGAWLHVDAAMAGSAMILPECRALWHGIDNADSIVVNPHKWLGAAFDCSVMFVRDPEHLERVMSTNPSYLRTAVDEQVKNYRDWGIALGRRFRALKLWSLIRTHGTERLQRRLRRDLDNAQWLREQVEGATDWRVLAPVALQTLCVRHEPAGLEDDKLDQYTLAWHDRVMQSRRAWLTPAQLDGRWMVRISIGALPTERVHVEELWTEMKNAADGA
ncbi:MAG: pyridoxal-dependent decarboxylase [bacterium]|nr:pyridoxal-dependent decarboxylase [bacterium]